MESVLFFRFYEGSRNHIQVVGSAWQAFCPLSSAICQPSDIFSETILVMIKTYIRRKKEKRELSCHAQCLAKSTVVLPEAMKPL